jgi:cell division transport system ATP-binding protein
MIEFSDVYKVYDNGTNALKGVNLRVEQGDFAFIVGPSGAGKSTLIKLLLREEKCTSGEIIVNNFKLSTLRHKDIPYLRRTMGVVFQDFRLMPNKTAYENVAFAMRVIGASNYEIRKRVPYVLGLMGLPNKGKCYPSELSGGEQQRVSIARAIVNNPSVIIADEPTGNVDPKMSLEIMGLLSEINKRGTTVLVVTHERHLVDVMRKRVIVIEGGKVTSDRSAGRYL